MGDTTDHLLKAIEHAKKGDLEKARKIISEIRASIEKAIHETIEDSGLKQQCSEWANERFEEIDKVLLGISLLRDLSPRSLDYFLSFGEKLSTSIVNAALSSAGLKTRYLMGGEAGIVTDENFGSAEPVLKVTNEKLKDFSAAAD